MRDRALARFGMVMCLPPIIATWQMGDHGATAWFAFCCGFFFREQLSPTDSAAPGSTKVRHPQPSQGETA